MISDKAGWVKLGEGSYGKVFLNLENPNMVRKEAYEKGCNVFINQEYQFMNKFDKPFIRKAFNYIEDDICSFDMEFYFNKLGSRSANNNIDEFGKYIIIYGISKAVECISNENLIHRDIKPSNIMLNSKNYPILSDFGISRELKHFNPLLSRTGTAVFTKPLFKDSTNVADVSVDIYSIGTLIYHLFFGFKFNETRLFKNEFNTKSEYFMKRKDLFDPKIDNDDNNDPYSRLFRMCCDIENKCTLRDVFDSLDQIRNQRYGDKQAEFNQFQRWLNGEINVRNNNEFNSHNIDYEETDEPFTPSMTRNTK